MTKKIDFDVRVEAGIVILYISGSFNYENLNHFRRLIYSLTSQGVKKMIINLSRLAFIDSTGIGCLIAAVRHVFKKDGVIYIVLTSARIQKMFEQVRADSIIPIFDKEKLAIEEILNPTKDSFTPKIALKKLADFFNPIKTRGEEIILTDPGEYHINRDLAVYVDILSKNNLRRVRGRISRIMDGNSGIEITFEASIDLSKDSDIYCIISYFSDKQWFEFEDNPFRVEASRLWLKFPKIVAMIERRSTLRIKCDFPLIFQICDVVGSRLRYEGRVKNIGENGLLMTTSSSFPVCDCVGLQFALPGNSREMVAIARIVRHSHEADGEYHLGTHFLIINENTLRSIQQFIIRKNPK